MLFGSFLLANVWWTASHAAAIQNVMSVEDMPKSLDPRLRSLNEDLIKQGHPGIRLMEPVAKVCYSRTPTGKITVNETECATLMANRTSDEYMTSRPGSYYFGNFATCQRTGEGCSVPLLNVTAAEWKYGAHISNASICHQGSVPDYYIEVQDAKDVVTVFKHAKDIGRPLVIKNTGHDWKGRSSGPGALALWMHNLNHKTQPILYNASFIPDGCNTSTEQVVKFGAGEQWGGIYEFARHKNLTVLGGTCPTVGAVGWLHGGGHSPLTPSRGMGVDNVRQFRIVTPDGKDLIANACQNRDLFRAVNGGGGATFGVVMEMWYKAEKEYPVQGFFVDLWGLDAGLNRQYIEILVRNANKWAQAGWGGYINTARQKGGLKLVNAKEGYTQEDAERDLEPLMQFARMVGAKPINAAFPSWNAYFKVSFADPSNHQSMWGGAVGSRLVPPQLFDDEYGRLQLVDTLLDLHYSRLNMWIMMVTPSAFDTKLEKYSALHPSWASATWLVRINDRWDSYYEAATGLTNHRNFERVHAAMNRIRRLTPDVGVSLNEADIWEPNHEVAFWGLENYDELVETKKRYDPHNILKVIQGVGAKKLEDRFRCYPRQDEML